MFYYIIAIAVVIAFLAGWKLTSRNAYESAAYSVIKSEGQIELREYPDLMMATTDMRTQAADDDGSFGRLFGYISGGNEQKKKIAMTTPVFMEGGEVNNNGQMGFVIPSEVAGGRIPQPTGQRVHLTKRPAGQFAVLRFSGRLSSDAVTLNLAKLEAWIEKQDLTTAGEPETAGYDPPWTPGPLRRNEILIRVQPR